MIITTESIRTFTFKSQNIPQICTAAHIRHTKASVENKQVEIGFRFPFSEQTFTLETFK